MPGRLFFFGSLFTRSLLETGANSRQEFISTRTNFVSIRAPFDAHSLANIKRAHQMGRQDFTGTRRGGRGGRFTLHALERVPRGYCVTPQTQRWIDLAFNQGPAFISRTSVLTPGIY